MPPAPLPPDESARLAALFECHVLDTEPESAFDDLTQLASRLCHAPIALVSLVDRERQWFKSACGLDAQETPRDMAFCAYAIRSDAPLIIRDATRDPRTRDNPLVLGPPGIRFYAGIPLRSEDGFGLGTLCVIDLEPRDISKAELHDLAALARQAASQLELRRNLRKIEEGRTVTHAANRALEFANKELKRKNRELDEFSYIASHDLQEPLRKLLSFSELLPGDVGGDLPPNAQADLDFITDAARRMSTLVEDLLTLSRAGAAAMKSDTISLHDCVERARHALAARIEDTRANISVGVLPDVTGDPTMLTQLIQNLVGNALKFIPTDATPDVRISAERQAGDWVISVTDNGLGIEPAYREQIFGSFKRLHGRGDYEGSGIGLAICRKTVERHGGRIWVESVPGEGATFRFALPVIEETSACMNA